MPKQLVIVEAFVPGAAPEPPDGAHVEPPIYIPVEPPPGLWPPDAVVTPPIYFPVHIWGPTDPRPTNPIYLPVDGEIIWGPDDPRPSLPIYIPIDPPTSPTDPLPPHVDNSLPGSMTDEEKEALKEFLFGNLPPFESVHPV